MNENITGIAILSARIYFSSSKLHFHVHITDSPEQCGNVFCANGGTCEDGSCICKGQWFGMKCEGSTRVLYMAERFFSTLIYILSSYSNMNMSSFVWITFITSSFSFIEGSKTRLY